MFTKRLRFFYEVWEELGKVTWPSRTDAIKMTLLVILASVVISALLGALDFVLVNFITKIVVNQ